MTIVDGLRIIDSNAQTGTTWWNWTIMHILCKDLVFIIIASPSKQPLSSNKQNKRRQNGKEKRSTRRATGKATVEIG